MKYDKVTGAIGVLIFLTKTPVLIVPRAARAEFRDSEKLLAVLG